MQVRDAAPLGTTYSSDTLFINSQDQNELQELPAVMDLGDIGPGQSGIIKFSVTVNEDATGDLTNTARISATDIPEFTRSVSNTVSVNPVIDNADTSKSVRPARTVIRGEILKYTISISNSGTATATDVQVSETLPIGTSYKPDSLVVTVGNRQETFFDLPDPIPVGRIPPRQKATIVLEVTVDRNAAPGIITNTSRISGTGLDEFTRIVSNSVSVQPVLDNTRTIVGVRPTGLVARGGTLEYTIVVRNEGTATARDVQVVEQLPAGTIFFPGTLVINGVPQGDVFELEPIDLGDIDPGKEGRVILEARIRSSASAGVLTSVVEISGAGIAPFTRSVSSNLSAERSITAAGKVEGTVLLQRRNDHSGTVVTFEGPQVKVVETDADGSFSATLEAGHYTVRAEHAYHLPAITEIDVQQGQVLVLNATLRCCDVDMDGVISIVDLVLQAQNFNISESEWR